MYPHPSIVYTQWGIWRNTMVRHSSTQNFQRDILNSDKPVLVDFWAPWCMPCRLLAPILENVDKKVENSARIYKINVDEEPQLASQYGISGIPTVLHFDKGQIVNKYVGVQPEKTYLEAFGVK